jgi:hypothetical protein
MSTLHDFKFTSPRGVQVLFGPFLFGEYLRKQKKILASIQFRTLYILVLYLNPYQLFLYGNETRPFSLREGCISRIFQTKALKRVFGPKRRDAIGQCSKVHKENIHKFTRHRILLGGPNKDKMCGSCSTHMKR